MTIADQVLFIDGESLVIDKPAGLAVDRPRDGSPSVEAMLDELTFGFQRPPKLVHRIDRDTSGCLLLSRNPKAHKRFHQSFEEGRVAKDYLAILDGMPKNDEGVIDLALSKTSTAQNGWRMRGDAKGKAAVTRWKVIARGEGRALVAFHPQTGRTHQIRVHAAEGIGIPIMGDPVYGTGGPSMMLHAASLRLPREGKPDVFAQAQWPARFAEAGFANG